MTEPEPLAPHPAATAPLDGRVIRGWFSHQRERRLIAVAWSRGRWVDLTGAAIPPHLVLEGWGDE